MKVYLATDHAGLELKEKVKAFLIDQGYEVEDCGAYVYEKDDDYPDFVSKAAEAVSKDPNNSRGIIFGGSGQGEVMVANKYKNVRAVVFFGENVEMVRVFREHNDANILSLGARFLSEDNALKTVDLFLKTPFLGEERHVRRIEKIKRIEQKF